MSLEFCLQTTALSSQWLKIVLRARTAVFMRHAVVLEAGIIFDRPAFVNVHPNNARPTGVFCVSPAEKCGRQHGQDLIPRPRD